jgi:hypothetical protein
MTPLQNHITVIPDTMTHTGGLISVVKTPTVKTGTVERVSEEISEVEPGDKVAYLAGREKNLCSKTILHLDVVLGKL